MNISTAVWVTSGVCAFLAHPAVVYSGEKLLETSVSARTEYNDNVFLTTLPHDAVSSIVITPSLSGIVKEQNWQVKLKSQLRLNQYSNHSLDSNEQLFDLSGQYNAERNIFSIGLGHNLVSSLNTISTDFGLSSQRVKRKTESISPQYRSLLTERLVLTLSYTYSDTEYLDIKDDTRFVSSYTETGTGALRYNLTEKDQVSINFQAIDYTRKDKLGDIQLFDVNIGFNHKFSEALSLDLAIGASRRDSTNLQTSVLDFFGTTILVPQEINTETRGSTFNLELNKLLETGSVGVKLNRNTTTNSFGGLDEKDKLVIKYDHKFSRIWTSSIVVSYEDSASISTATVSTDREIVFFQAQTYYSFSRNLNMSISYSYNQRKFKNLSTSDTPHSNQLQLGLSYNLPTFSTF